MDVSIVCCEEDICYHESLGLNLQATDVTAGMMAFEIIMTPDQNFMAATDWAMTDDDVTKITVPMTRKPRQPERAEVGENVKVSLRLLVRMSLSMPTAPCV